MSKESRYQSYERECAERIRVARLASKMRYLYAIVDIDLMHVKIGVAFEPKERLRAFWKATGHDMGIHSQVVYADAFAEETRVHNLLAHARVYHGTDREWFDMKVDEVDEWLASREYDTTTGLIDGDDPYVRVG